MRNLTLTIHFCDISQSFVSATKYENTSTVECKKKVDKFSAAWSSLRFWLAADYDCILGCLAECKKI
jgi:hypothetical protein